MLGTTRLRVEPPVVPIRFKRRLRATCVEFVSVSVSVTLALAKVTLAEPTTASSKAVPRLTFVTLPHVARFSPVAISWSLRLLYVLDIFSPYVGISVQFGVCASLICPQTNTEVSAALADTPVTYTFH